MIARMIAGMTGEVFNLGGRVAGQVPTTGRPDAIQFTVGRLHAATGKVPAWADLDVRRPDGSRVAVRIDPDILDSSLFRFFDLIVFAATETKRIFDFPKRYTGHVTLQGETFVVWPERMRSLFGLTDVIMIDRKSRMIAHGNSFANEGE